jgi:hypothetical protein
MRAIFFLLVLANLAFLAWHMGYLGGTTEQAGEGNRLAQQIAPEKIRIIAPDQAKKLAETPSRPANVCIEWGPFTGPDYERLQVLLTAMEPAPRYATRRIDETAGWWVFVPAQPNKAAADKKGAELKALGVTEFFVINDDGPNKNAISLGVFKTEDAAKGYLDKLVKQGVKTARAAERETKVAKTVLTFREVDEALKQKLGDLRREFPGQEQKDCVAEERKGDAGSDKRADEAGKT